VRVYLTENPTGRGLFLFFHTSISESGVSSHERRVEVFKNGLHEMNTAKRGKETAPTAPENFGGISLQDSVVLFF
jgi:hypothetical protein